MNGERGAATMLIVLAVTALFSMAGLAYDGGRILAARREAIDAAQSAARAGAQSVDSSALRSGRVALEHDAAVRAAEAFLHAAGYEGDATVVGNEVHVTVTITRDLALLSLVGMHERTVEGRGEARPVRGVSGPET